MLVVGRVAVCATEFMTVTESIGENSKWGSQRRDQGQEGSERVWVKAIGRRYDPVVRKNLVRGDAKR